MDTWANFHRYISNLETTTEKGFHFELFCYYMLQQHPLYNYRIEKLWLYRDFPQKRKEKLKLSLTDKGTDIMLQLRSEYRTTTKYVSVQCKFLSNVDSKIPYGELSTFCCDAMKVKEGIFIATQYRPSDFNGCDNLETCSISQILLPNIMYMELEHPELIKLILGKVSQHFENKHDIGNESEIRYNMDDMQVREYQKECLEAGLIHFRDHNKGTIRSAGGTGKTFMSIMLFLKMYHPKLEENEVQALVSSLYNHPSDLGCLEKIHLLNYLQYNNQPSKLMIVVPSLFLIEQTMKYFLQTETDRNNNYIINFCSIHDVGHNKDLKYTTDENELLKYIGLYNVTENKNLVVIVTYNSIEKCIDTFRKANYRFNMIIFDEAHTLVNKNRKRSDWFYDNHARLPCDKQLFISATPKFMLEHQSGDKRKMVSMNNEEQFGKVFFNYSMRRAIDEGYLSDYRVYVPISSTITIKHVYSYLRENGLDDDFKRDKGKEIDDGMKEYSEEEDKEEEEEENEWSEEDNGYEENKESEEDEDDIYPVPRRILVSAFTIKDAFYRGKKKCMAICNTIKDMKLVYKIVNLACKLDDLEIYSNWIDSSIKTSKRNQIIREFETSEKPALIVSVRTLTTGADIPCVDSLSIVNPIHSQALIIQIISRGIRLYGQKVLDILLPILQEEESFEGMRDILMAISKEDDKFMEHVNLSGNKKLKLMELNFNTNKGYNNWSAYNGKLNADKLELFNLKENFDKWRMEMLDTSNIYDRFLEKTRTVIKIINETGKMISGKDRKYGHSSSHLHDLKYLYINTKNNLDGRKFIKERMQEFIELEACVVFMNWYNERKKMLTNEELLQKTRNVILVMNQTGEVITNRDEKYGSYIQNLKYMYVNTKDNKDGSKFVKERMQEFIELEMCVPFTNWYANKNLGSFLEKTRNAIVIMNKTGRTIRDSDKEYGNYVCGLKRIYTNTKLNREGKFTEERMQEFYELEQCLPFSNWYENQRKENPTNEELLEKTRNVIMIMNQTGKIVPQTNKEYGAYVSQLKKLFVNSKEGKGEKFTEDRMQELRELEKCETFVNWYENKRRKLPTNEELLERTLKSISIMEQTGKIIPLTNKEYGKYIDGLKTLYTNTKLGKTKGFTEERKKEMDALEKCPEFMAWYNKYLQKKKNLT